MARRDCDAVELLGVFGHGAIAAAPNAGNDGLDDLFDFRVGVCALEKEFLDARPVSWVMEEFHRSGALDALRCN